MAKRLRRNVTGDLAELHVTELMLEHGMAINALTASDTGWDLHCHVAEEFIIDASKSPGTLQWNLSGRTAHFQVKGGGPGKLKPGTVRSWLTGSASGPPTFMFWQRRSKDVFSTPTHFEKWLRDVPPGVGDTDQYPTLVSKTTHKGAMMGAYEYDPIRFPAVLRLWIDYGDVALDLNHLTSRMNSRDSLQHESALDELVEHAAVAVWADKGYQIDVHMNDMAATLADLYDSAGLGEPGDRAENYLMGSAVDILTNGDRRFSRSSVPVSVARCIDSQEPEQSAMKLLDGFKRLFREDAAPLVAPAPAKKRP